MSEALVKEITLDILADQAADNLKKAREEEVRRARTGPASWSWSGPAKNLQDLGYKAGTSALRSVEGARHWALDRQSATELAALSVACEGSLRPVIKGFALVIPGWMQKRPSADAGVLDPIPRDPLGREIGNPWLEATKDVASQILLSNAAPRLAKWLEQCAKHGGAPTAQMLVDLEIEKEEASQMRRVCDAYNAKMWAENKIRRDTDMWPDGFSLTRQMEWSKSLEQTDKWLIKQHRIEAEAGPLRLHFDNHTVCNALAARDPKLREIHKAAASLLKKWAAEAAQKAA
jgi:hypothetical protein